MGFRDIDVACYAAKLKLQTFKYVHEFEITGFSEVHPPKEIYELSNVDTRLTVRYEEFIERIMKAVSKRYLPILRLSDGEYEVLLGKKIFNKRLSFPKNIRALISTTIIKLKYGRGIYAATKGIYESGRYSKYELKEIRENSPKLLKDIATKGMIAPHLNMMKRPFCEQYFKPFEIFLEKHQIGVTAQNTIPFYFVYAFAASDRFKELLRGRSILVVHGATGNKQMSIKRTLLENGAKDVDWIVISEAKSYYNVVDKQSKKATDLILLGGGIGKFNLFHQLESFNVPVIDCGYMFEVWANPKNKYKRVYCANDIDWKVLGVENVFEKGI